MIKNAQQDYADDVDDSVVAASIRAIGRCPRHQLESMQQCLTALMAMIKSRHGQPIMYHHFPAY